MTRSVEDAAIVLSIIAGEDPNDKRTLSQPLPVPDYTKALTTTALPLQGKRIGIPRSSLPPTTPPSILSAFTQSIQTLQNLGATIVDPANLPFAKDIFDCGDQILSVDFKIEIQQYLAGLKHIPFGIQSLADIIKFNIDHPDLELPEGYADQGRLIDSEATVGRDEAYVKALARNLEMGAEKGIDFVLKEFKLDALVLPAKGTSSPAALAGYPIVTVPLGFFPDDEPITYDGATEAVAYPAPGMPFGISFFGTAFDEYALIGIAYVFEQETKVRLSRRAVEEAMPKTQLKYSR